MIIGPILIHDISSEQVDTYISDCSDVKWEEFIIPLGNDPSQVWA